MFDDKLQMNSKLIYDDLFLLGGGRCARAGRSAPVQAGVRPECARAGRSAPGARQHVPVGKVKSEQRL